MERPKENRTQASESGTQQGHHLQGKPHVFILRLYFNFKGVHKHANVTTQANSATWKLQCRMEGVGMVLQSYWPSVKLIWPQSASSGSWPNYFDGKQEHLYLEPFRNDSYGEQVVFDTLSKILKGTMDIPRKLSTIMGKVACWDTVWWKAVQLPSNSNIYRDIISLSKATPTGGNLIFQAQLQAIKLT